MKLSWIGGIAFVRNSRGNVLFTFDPARDLVSVKRDGETTDVDLRAIRQTAPPVPVDKAPRPV